jgi:hypothetical protein
VGTLAAGLSSPALCHFADQAHFLYCAFAFRISIKSSFWSALAFRPDSVQLFYWDQGLKSLDWRPVAYTTSRFFSSCHMFDSDINRLLSGYVVFVH